MLVLNSYSYEQRILSLGQLEKFGASLVLGSKCSRACSVWVRSIQNVLTGFCRHLLYATCWTSVLLVCSIMQQRSSIILLPKIIPWHSIVPSHCSLLQVEASSLHSIIPYTRHTLMQPSTSQVGQELMLMLRLSPLSSCTHEHARLVGMVAYII